MIPAWLPFLVAKLEVFNETLFKALIAAQELQPFR